MRPPFSTWLFYLLTCSVLLLFSALSRAAWAEPFWSEHEKGWHWYDDPAPAVNNSKDAPVGDPVQQMEAWHQQVKQTLDRAILNPTQENVKAYITLQNQVAEQSGRFALAWRTALLNNPELDYSLSHPTNNLGKQIYLGEQKTQEDEAIATLAKHSGLFFFYRSNCPYCQRFAPIVKDFSTRYGIAVVPITTDGISLPAFPHSQIDQGQAARFKVNVEPALFTVDPYTQKIVPVGYGLMSQDELRARILAIATAFNTSPAGENAP